MIVLFYITFGYIRELEIVCMSSNYEVIVIGIVLMTSDYEKISISLLTTTKLKYQQLQASSLII